MDYPSQKHMLPASCAAFRNAPYRNAHFASFVREVLADPETRTDDDADGGASSAASLRLNDAALYNRDQTGLNATCATLRLSAQQAAMRPAPFGPSPWRKTMSGCFARTLSSASRIPSQI